MKDRINLKISPFFIFLLLISSFTFSSCSNETKIEADPLTIEERTWLKNHDNKIILGVYPHYPPIDFTDKKGNYKGFSADYIKLIEKKLNFTFKIKYENEWNNLLNSIKMKEIDCIPSITDTVERKDYMHFTDPYYSIPNVIITKQGINDFTSLNKLKNKIVALVKGYATVNYIKKNYPEIIIKEVENDLTAMQMVSFGTADAMVIDRIVVTHYIEKLGIVNLRVAGTTDFVWNFSIGIRKDLPILHSILQKGFNQITDEEQNKITERWLRLEFTPIYKRKLFWIIITAITGFILLVIGLILIWNRALQKEVRKKTHEIQMAHDQLEIRVDERTKELSLTNKDLKEALEKIKELKGLIPICSTCKKIRDDSGYWNQIEMYIESHTDAFFSHGICPDCNEKLYGKEKWFQKTKDKSGK